jgi:hypothetical protein
MGLLWGEQPKARRQPDTLTEEKIAAGRIIAEFERGWDPKLLMEVSRLARSDENDFHSPWHGVAKHARHALAKYESHTPPPRPDHHRFSADDPRRLP